MDIKAILSRVDHTELSQAATFSDIRRLCDEGIQYSTASVCIPSGFVSQAKAYVGDRLPLCTVVGFPNGYCPTEIKCAETARAVAEGADEIDMVIRIGWLKEGKDDKVLEEIRAVKEACDGKLLKVIVETCLLTQEEKIRVCDVVSRSGAEFIKTSTGFAGGGATREDVALFRQYVAPGIRIKAAGGIRTLEDATAFLALGADRLGTSRIVRLVRQMEKEGAE